MKSKKVQFIADGAAKAGAEAFNQYRDQPNLKKVRRAMFDYISNQQGTDHLDHYRVVSDFYGQGYMIESLDIRDISVDCTRGFTVTTEGVEAVQDLEMTSTVLGMSLGHDGEHIPITLKISEETPSGSTINHYSATINDDGEHGGMPDFSPTGASANPPPGQRLATPPDQTFDVQKDSTVKIEATGLDPFGGLSPLFTASTQNSNVLILTDGDPIPPQVQSNLKGWFSPYVKNGRIQLDSKQVLVTFELGNSPGGSGSIGTRDYQDLTLLLDVGPSPTGPTSVFPTLKRGSWSYRCEHPPGSYKVGVLAYGKSESYFWPDEVTGTDGRGIVKKAVALVEPVPLYRTMDPNTQCGVFAGGVLQVNQELLSRLNPICTRSTIQSGPGASGSLHDLYLPQTSNVDLTPFSHNGTIMPINSSPSIPEFNHTNPSHYDVRMTVPEYLSDWSQGSCTAGTRRMKLYSGGFARWSATNDFVCVRRIGNNFWIDPAANGTHNGQIQAPGGQNISIYAGGDVFISGESNGIDGGLYSTGSVNLDTENARFTGDPSKLGGLAIWGNHRVSVHEEDIEVEGIFGSGGDLAIGPGNTASNFNHTGLFMVGGEMLVDSKTKVNRTPGFNPASYYDASVVSGLHQWWNYNQQIKQDRARYSRIRVSLIE